MLSSPVGSGTNITGTVGVLSRRFRDYTGAEPVIVETLRQEEERFRRTLGRGMTLLELARESLSRNPLLRNVQLKDVTRETEGNRVRFSIEAAVRN